MQKEPAAPVYSEHSFVTWRSLVRWGDADTEVTPALTAKFRAAALATSMQARARPLLIFLVFIGVSSFPLFLFDWRFPWPPKVGSTLEWPLIW